MKNTTILKAGIAPFALGLALASSPALAQDATGGDTDADEPAAGSIVVTGSRIARPDLEAPSPVTVVGEEQIELTGTQTLESLLNELPQVIPGATTTSNNPSGTFGTVDLRGLGPGRTLILLDGERLPPSTTTGVVDISLIPTQLVRRVEIVTGGASAVYGSDAIAGVVNFILRDDFEGVEVNAQSGINEDGTGFEFAVGGVVGGNFADGRGNLTLSGSYFERESISTGRYDYTRVDAAVFGAADFSRVYPVDDPSDILPGDVRLASGGSATPPWGQIVSLSGNPFQNLSTLLPGQFAAANTDCNAATPGVPVNGGQLSFNDQGQLTPYFTAGATTNPLCGIPLRSIGSSRYNFAPDNFVQLPYDRYNFVMTGSYEFSDETRLKLFGAYTESRLTQQLAPTPAGVPATSFTINPTTAQFIPADLRIALNSRSNPNGNFVYGRRFTETGPRIGQIESRNVNARAILEHDLSDKWNVNFVASWGRNALDSIAIGNINRTAVEQGVNGCINQSGVRNGPGVLPNCVPVNIFGPNSLTPDMVDFVQTDTVDYDRFEQVRAAVNLTGELFELPGGPAGIAVGAEYRKDTGSSTPDDAKIRGEIIGFNAAAPQAGSIIAKEVYGEIRLPILGGDGFPDLLALEAGARYSDYSSIGGLFNWKVGAEFAPVDWLRFRGSYNRAARAPNVQELFQGGDQGFPGYTDPCNDNAARTAAILAQCVATTPGSTAALFTGFVQANSQVQSFQFGDPSLTEERAETWTAGVVASPDWFPIGRLNLTGDYYDITLRGAIQGQGVGFYLNACYRSAPPAECDRVSRDPATGQITAVNLGRRNNPDTNGPFHVAGVDVGLDWVIGMDELFGGSSDWRLRIQNIYSYLIDFEIGGVDFVGTSFGGGFSGVASESRNTLTVAAENERFTAQIRWIHSDGADDSLPAAYDIPGAVGFETPSLDYADLSLRWRVNERFSLTAIVNNITDERPVQTTAFSNEQSNTAASYYAPIFYGRGYTISTTVRF